VTTMPTSTASPAPRRVCRTCGRAEGPDVRMATPDECWRDYARRRRHEAAAPARERAAERLEILAAAYARVVRAAREHTTRLRRLRATARLAYADGLSLNQVADLIGRTPMGVTRWLPREQTAARHVTHGGYRGGPRATPETVERWAPLLAANAEQEAAAFAVKLETTKAFRELLQEALDPGTFGRVRPLQVAGRLGITDGAVFSWLHGGHVRCQGTTKAGVRCRLPAKTGHRTCGLHRDQEEPEQGAAGS
jgi:hypothetical protein